MEAHQRNQNGDVLIAAIEMGKFDQGESSCDDMESGRSTNDEISTQDINFAVEASFESDHDAFRALVSGRVSTDSFATLESLPCKVRTKNTEHNQEVLGANLRTSESRDTLTTLEATVTTTSTNQRSENEPQSQHEATGIFSNGEEHQQSSRRRKCIMRSMALGGISLALSAGIVATVSYLNDGSERNSNAAGSNIGVFYPWQTLGPSQSPFQYPDADMNTTEKMNLENDVDLEDGFVISIPLSTQLAIVEEPTSPQALAYRWLLNDRSLSNYSDLRLLQRFALATLFFSTNGPRNWARDDHWLDHYVHECIWFSQDTLKVDGAQVSLGNPCEDGFPAEKSSQGTKINTNKTDTNSGVYKNLFLNQNQLSGTLPPEISLLNSLQWIILEQNQLKGSLPTQLGLLGNMDTIQMSHNMLTGTFPTEMAQMTGLASIDLSHSHLTGPLPSQLGLLSELQFLLLMKNDFNVCLPSELGGLSDLSHLLLSDNIITGPIPTSFSNLTSLQELVLQGNILTSTLPRSFGKLSNLERLMLGSNWLMGQIPSQIGMLSLLQDLDLSTNALDGSIPSEMAQMPLLESLLLHWNQLSGSLPSQLGVTTALQQLYFQSNGLTGSVPNEWGGLLQLRNFFLAANMLSGTIPSDLARAASLEKLLLENNQLSGSIPSQLGVLSSLSILWLGKNKLRASIPSQIGLATSLVELSLFSNQLTSTIPSQLGKLEHLDALWLPNNKLSGSIPSQIGLLQQALNRFSVSGNNNITGTIPEGVCSIGRIEFDCSQTLCGCDCNCSSNTNTP